MPYEPVSGGWGTPPPAPDYSLQQQYDSFRRSEYVFLRKHGNCVGLCVVAMFLLQYGLTLLLLLFDPGDLHENCVAFNHAVSAIFYSVISLFVPFLLLSLKKGSPRYIGVLPFSASHDRLKVVLVIMAGFGVCMFSDLIATFVSDLIHNAGLKELNAEQPVSAAPFDFVLNVLCTAMMPAMVEEFVFRGVVMQPLRRYGEHFAVWSSAIIFGLMHGTLTSFAFAFPVGVILGYAAVLTGSLWPGIVIHFLNNFYAVIVTDLGGVNAHAAEMLSNVLLYVGLFLGAGALVFLVMTRSFRFEKRITQAMMKGNRFKGFFLSVPMIISVAALIFFMVIVNLD